MMAYSLESSVSAHAWKMNIDYPKTEGNSNRQEMEMCSIFLSSRKADESTGGWLNPFNMWLIDTEVFDYRWI